MFQARFEGKTTNKVTHSPDQSLRQLHIYYLKRKISAAARRRNLTSGHPQKHAARLVARSSPPIAAARITEETSERAHPPPTGTILISQIWAATNEIKHGAPTNA